MKLSIITINYNNAEGLRKTLASVAAQTYRDIEHIIVDGGSTDGSVDVIREYAEGHKSHITHHTSHIVKWTSEPDKGIYNAMNHGIEIALGRRIVNEDHTSNITHHTSLKEHHTSNITHHTSLIEHHTSNITHNTSQESLCDYVQILNSGDLLAAPDVTERMMAALHQTSHITHQTLLEDHHTSNIKHQTLLEDHHTSNITHQTLLEDHHTSHITHQTSVENRPAIFYGNMLKSYDGKTIINRDTCGGGMYTPESFLYFYKGTLNHDCAYIRRDLFEKYGLYNEQMKICSDWEWYVRAIVLGGEKPVYTNIDVTIFDMNGVSESYGKNADIIKRERREYLEKILLPSVLHDYDVFSFPITQYQRLKKHHLWGLVYFMERVLFKLEKWHVLR